MRRKINSDIPAWAISQAEVDSVGFPPGFIRDFINYVEACSDAPKAFAVGTGLGILAVACGNCNLVVQGDAERSITLPIRLWQAIIGTSGQRKSKVMDLGLGVLQRAGSPFLLPQDASIEAWHDSIADLPICMLHQEELSGLLDAQTRNYSQGLQSFILSLWQGTPKDRKTKAGGLVEIQRPRLNILGAIPPDVFFRKTKNLDWKSGFLPRFLFWGGVREEWQELGLAAPKYEENLANLLRYVHLKSDGEVFIGPNVAALLSNWFYEKIEMHCQEMLEDTYAGLLRLQEIGQIIAGLVALSRLDNPLTKGKSNRCIVSEEDMRTTINLLNLCKRTVESISGRAGKNARCLREEEVVHILQGSQEGYTVAEIAKKLNSSLNETRSLLHDLESSEVVKVKLLLSKKPGRPAKKYLLREQL